VPSYQGWTLEHLESVRVTLGTQKSRLPHRRSSATPTPGGRCRCAITGNFGGRRQAPACSRREGPDLPAQLDRERCTSSMIQRTDATTRSRCSRSGRPPRRIPTSQQCPDRRPAPRRNPPRRV